MTRISTRSPTPASSARARASSACGSREGDAPDRRAVLARGVDRQASPAAPDVEHAHPGLQLELAADQLELGALGVLQRLDALLEQRAAVGHRLVQEQGEELVRRRRSGGGPPRRRGAWCGGAETAAARRPEEGAGDASPAARSADATKRRRAPQAERRRLPATEQGDDPVEVVDVDLAAHIGAPEPELARRAEQVADRPRRVDRKRRARGGSTERASRPRARS